MTRPESRSQKFYSYIIICVQNKEIIYCQLALTTLESCDKAAKTKFRLLDGAREPTFGTSSSTAKGVAKAAKRARAPRPLVSKDPW